MMDEDEIPPMPRPGPERVRTIRMKIEHVGKPPPRIPDEDESFDSSPRTVFVLLEEFVPNPFLREGDPRARAVFRDPERAADFLRDLEARAESARKRHESVAARIQSSIREWVADVSTGLRPVHGDVEAIRRMFRVERGVCSPIASAAALPDFGKNVRRRLEELFRSLPPEIPRPPEFPVLTPEEEAEYRDAVSIRCRIATAPLDPASKSEFP